MRSILILLFCFLFLPCSLPAADPAPADQTDLTVLEDVVVRAPAERSGAPDDIVRSEDIPTAGADDPLLDSLGNLAGVQLRRGTASGAENDKLRLRGFGETRLRVLVDGVPYQRDGSYGNGPVDWSILAPAGIERIEVVRGAGSARYGNTLGGSVNIVTRQDGGEPVTEASAAYGSRETAEVRLSHAWGWKRLGWNVALNHFETDGYLRNNDFTRDSLQFGLDLDLPAGFTVGGGLRLAESETGMAVDNRTTSPFFDPGEPVANYREVGGPGVSSRLVDGRYGDDTRAEDRNTVIDLFAEKTFEDGAFRLTYRRWDQERDETYTDAADGRVIYRRHTEAEDGNWQLNGDGHWMLGDHRLGFGAETRRYGWGDQTVPYIDTTEFTGAINFLPFYKNGFLGQPRCMHYTAGYLEDRWQINEKIAVTPGVRLERFEADPVDPAAFGFNAVARVQEITEENADPRLAVTVDPWTAGSLTAAVNRVHRYPNSPEYFWWYLNNGTGFFNTDLNPEASWQYELELAQRFGEKVTARLRGYHYDIDDYIASTTVPGTGTVVYNIAEVAVEGVELELAADLPWRLHAWANGTWQKADKSGDPWDTNNRLTSHLPDFPETMANLGLDYNGERLTVKTWLNWVDDREHFNGAVLTRLDSYTLLNVSADYRLYQSESYRWHLFAAVENIADETYQEEEGYPMPGASVSGGVKIVF